jgi:hypothetical protein
VAEGFPTSIFLVDEDLTREDGVIRCREITVAETVQLGWRVWRIVRILRSFPWPPF